MTSHGDNKVDGDKQTETHKTTSERKRKRNKRRRRNRRRGKLGKFRSDECIEYIQFLKEHAEWVLKNPQIVRDRSSGKQYSTGLLPEVCLPPMPGFVIQGSYAQGQLPRNVLEAPPCSVSDLMWRMNCITQKSFYRPKFCIRTFESAYRDQGRIVSTSTFSTYIQKIPSYYGGSPPINSPHVVPEPQQFPTSITVTHPTRDVLHENELGEFVREGLPRQPSLSSVISTYPNTPDFWDSPFSFPQVHYMYHMMPRGSLLIDCLELRKYAIRRRDSLFEIFRNRRQRKCGQFGTKALPPVHANRTGAPCLEAVYTGTQAQLTLYRVVCPESLTAIHHLQERIAELKQMILRYPGLSYFADMMWENEVVHEILPTKENGASCLEALDVSLCADVIDLVMQYVPTEENILNALDKLEEQRREFSASSSLSSTNRNLEEYEFLVEEVSKTNNSHFAKLASNYLYRRIGKTSFIFDERRKCLRSAWMMSLRHFSKPLNKFLSDVLSSETVTCVIEILVYGAFIIQSEKEFYDSNTYIAAAQDFYEFLYSCSCGCES